MKRVNDIFSNITLVFLIFLIFFFMFSSWNYTVLSENKTNLFGSSISEISENTNENALLPTAIAIKNNDIVYAEGYNFDRNQTVFLSMKDEIIELLLTKTFNKVDELEFHAVFELPSFIYLRFDTPISAIVDVNSDLILSEILVFEKYIYLRCEEEYFKVLNFGFTTNEMFENVAYFVKNDSGNYYLKYTSAVELKKINVDGTTILDSDEMAKKFEFNPFLVEKYSVDNEKVTYVGVHNTLNFDNDLVEFKSSDARGDIFQTDTSYSNSDMIEIAVNSYNEIHEMFGYETRARAYDIYNFDNSTVVILNAVVDDVFVDFDDYACAFVFSPSGVSYIKMNLVRAVFGNGLYKVMDLSVFSESSEILPKYSLIGDIIVKKVVGG